MGAATRPSASAHSAIDPPADGPADIALHQLHLEAAMFVRASATRTFLTPPSETPRPLTITRAFDTGCISSSATVTSRVRASVLVGDSLWSPANAVRTGITSESSAAIRADVLASGAIRVPTPTEAGAGERRHEYGDYEDRRHRNERDARAGQKSGRPSRLDTTEQTRERERPQTRPWLVAELPGQVAAKHVGRSAQLAVHRVDGAAGATGDLARRPSAEVPVDQDAAVRLSTGEDEFHHSPA